MLHIARGIWPWMSLTSGTTDKGGSSTWTGVCQQGYEDRPFTHALPVSSSGRPDWPAKHASHMLAMHVTSWLPESDQGLQLREQPARQAACIHLQRIAHAFLSPNVQAEVQEGLVGVGLVATLHTLDLQVTRVRLSQAWAFTASYFRIRGALNPCEAGRLIATRVAAECRLLKGSDAAQGSMSWQKQPSGSCVPGCAAKDTY